MREIIRIGETKVIEIIDDGLKILAIDLINNKYINLYNSYNINSALIELNENNIASEILLESRKETIETLFKNNNISY